MKSNTKNQGQARKKKPVLKYVVILASVVVVIGLLRTFLTEPVQIDGTALEPGLRNGDRVFVNKRIGSISRGAILLFGHPQKPSIRILLRVVGLPGERVQLREGKLYIDGQQVSEPYVSEEYNRKNASTDEIVVPDNSYFFLGDNRDEAFDSRNMGPIPRNLVYGKYWARYWPL